MKKRPRGFLDPGLMPAEVFDYVRELHDLLWRVVRAQRPGASGDVSDLIEPAIEALERRAYVPSRARENDCRTCQACGRPREQQDQCTDERCMMVCELRRMLASQNISGGGS